MVSNHPKQGLLYVTAAKIWFIIGGLALHLVLPQFLDKSSFGVWSVIVGWMSSLNNAIVTITIQTISYFPAPETRKSVAWHTMRLQIILGAFYALSFFLLAPAIAQFEQDVTYIPYLRLGSIIMACYSIYAVQVGIVNVQHQFNRQAILDILFSSMRVFLVLSLAFITHHVLGALLGFTAAAIGITVVSVIWIGWPRKALHPQVSWGPIIKFYFPLFIYLLITNLLMFVDGFWLKRIASLWAQGQNLENFKAISNDLVGVYSAAQNLSRLPYQLILAAAFVIFPLLSKTTVNNDIHTAKKYIRSTLKYAFITLVGLAIILASRSKAGLLLVYKPTYSSGAEALTILAVCYVLFSLMAIVATILNSLGHIFKTLLITIGTFAITNIAIYLSLRQAHDPSALLLQASHGLLIGFGLGLIAYLLLLWKLYKVTFSPVTIVRVGIAMSGVWFLSWLWPMAGSSHFLGGKIGTLIYALLALILYVSILIISREISVSEIVSTKPPALENSAVVSAPEEIQ